MVDPGTALGIASLGIQVSEGLLKYYDKWRSYDRDIRDTYKLITDLATTFAQLRLSLDKIQHDHKQSERARDALRPCEESLLELQELLVKLKPYNAPDGLREGAWAQFRRATYPLKASTLTRLRELEEDIRDRLALALQTLQIDLAAASLAQLSKIECDIGSVDVSLKQVALQTNAAAGGVNTLLEAEEQRKLNEVLNWLSPDFQDPWLDYKAARDRHEPGTGDWLLASQSYKAWKSGQTPHVWLHGKAGCGKTVLCSTAINDMRQDFENATSMGFAIFFFSFANQKKQSVDDMLLCLIAQLASKPIALAILIAAHEKHKSGASVNAPLEKIFRDQVDALTDTVVFVDALDECPEAGDAQRKLLGYLQSIATNMRKLRLFATSRDEIIIRDAMEAIHADFVSIDVGQTDEDIKRYVRNEVETDPRLRRFTEASRSLIESKLAEKADGMFRWAHCQLEELKKMKIRTPRKVEQALGNLPRTLDETYDRMLARIDEVDRREARTILQWMVVQTRLMTLEELAETCIIDLDSGDVREEDRLDPESLIDLLGSLVVLRELGTRQVLLLAHFSVQEYLESDRIVTSSALGIPFKIEQGQSHAFVADSCMVYLRWFCSSTDPVSPDISRESGTLLEYARYEWLEHSAARSDGLLENEIWVLQHPAEASLIWLHRTCRTYVGLFRRLPHIFQEMYQSGADPDRALSCHGESMLHVAAQDGLTELAAMLLRAGAATEKVDKHGHTALYYAAERGWPDLVRLLLDAGADIDHDRPLVQAIKWPNFEVVELLVERGADLRGDLLHGIRFNWLPTIILLVANGADVAAQNIWKQTPLHCLDDTVIEGAEPLLSHGSNIEARDDQGFTPLLSSLFDRSPRLAEFLIEKGADVNAGSHCGHSALYLAVSQRHAVAIVDSLLEAGARVDDIQYGGTTALYEAVLLSAADVVQCLLDHGASVSARTSWGETALTMARRELDCPDRPEEAFRIMKMLIDRCDVGDLNTRDDNGREAIHQAAHLGRPDIVQQLLDKGVEVTVKTAKGNSPLAVARQTLMQLRSFQQSPYIHSWIIGVRRVIDLLSPHGEEGEGVTEEYSWTNKDREIFQQEVTMYDCERPHRPRCPDLTVFQRH